MTLYMLPSALVPVALGLETKTRSVLREHSPSRHHKE